VYDFLLVINSNLGPLTVSEIHPCDGRTDRIAMAKTRYSSRPTCCLYKNYKQKLEFQYTGKMDSLSTDVWHNATEILKISS